MRRAATTHTFTSGRRTLSYQRHGSGPLVVMLPGGPPAGPRFSGVGHLVHAEARERWTQLVTAFLCST